MADQALAQGGAPARTDAGMLRAQIKRMLGPAMVRKVRSLSRFAAVRALIHPDPEVQHWIAMGWQTAKATGFKVASGPFKGMDMEPVGEPGTMAIRELLGVYEEELHPWIETLVSHGYKDIIDIGAARGYYAVGLAIRMPSVRVVAFEELKAQADVLAQVAERNGVSSRVAVRGHCDHQTLREALKGREGALIVSDCEGAEFDLLDETELPALASCDLLVEVHGHRGAGLADMLEQRFQGTHWLHRMMPSREGTGANADGIKKINGMSQVPTEIRPDGVYWLLLLRQEHWPPQAGVTR